jgi:aryl-alcohol dehydrogenase-like predicted oxidoreductase
MGENRAVEKQTLGRTGLAITPVGLGLAALGRPAYINLHREQDLGSRRSVGDMERRCHTVLDAADRADICYFDAARSYGYAERFLASWLHTRAIEPGRVTVGSKWGYTYVGEWRLDVDVHEDKDHSLAALKRQYAESRSVLGRHLSLYQIHSATLESGVLADPHVLFELAAMQDDDVAIGVSLSGPRQQDTLRQALEAEVDGVNPFSSVQATFNILEPSVAGALEEARAAPEEEANIDLVLYCLDALRKYGPMRREEVEQVAYEIASVISDEMAEGDDEVHDDEGKVYRLESIEGEFTGIQLLCYMYVGFRLLDEDIDLGDDLEEEYEAAQHLYRKRYGEA